MNSAKTGDQIKSLVWGDDTYLVSQPFGTYNPGTANMYDYAAGLGWPAGTHVGIDVAVPKGTPIFAAEPGEVIQAGFSEYFRPMPVHILEEDGQEAIYGHLWTNDVKIGERVKAGQQLGTSGEQTEKGSWTPDGTGAHIHFELRQGNKAINPVPELTGAEGSIIPARGKLTKTLLLIGGVAVGGLIVWKVLG